MSELSDLARTWEEEGTGPVAGEEIPKTRLLSKDAGLEAIAPMLHIPPGLRGEVIEMEWPTQAPKVTVKIRTSGIRKERTATYARIQMFVAGLQMDWDNFNIERAELRHKLIRNVHKNLNDELKALVDEKLTIHYFDLLCFYLWDIYIAQAFPEDVPGDPLLPVEFLLNPYIMTEAGTILFAPPGRGKSYTGLVMAISVDEGLDHLWPCQQTPVLFINLERSKDSMARRVGLVNMSLGLEPERPLAMLNARGRTLTDVQDRVIRYIEQRGTGLIVLDSVSRSGSGALAEDKFANQIMDMLNMFQVAWLALGHTPRADESHVYGNTMFDAAGDVLVRLRTQEVAGQKLGIGLEITKANDIPRYPMEILAYEFDEFGLQHVRKALPGEFLEIEVEEKEESPGEIIYDALLQHGDMTITDVSKAADLPRTTCQRYLSAMRKDGNVVVVGKEGKALVYGAKTTP